MTDPGSQRSKRMPLNCPAEIADEKPSRRQFVDIKLIDHDPIYWEFNIIMSIDHMTSLNHCSYEKEPEMPES